NLSMSFSYQSTQGGNEDGNSLQKTADSTIIAALATPGTENAALPAPTSTPTPTDSPTPTKTPTPTKSPTKTPTPKPTNSPTPSVTNIPTVTKIISKTPTSTKTISPSQNKDVLANSTKSSANNFEEPKKEDKNDNTQKNNNFLPIIFISVGIAFLLACAIVIAYPFIVRFKREKLDG
ncbi:MAG: hypothetical protein M1450_05345, partial [Patescibacteria group bacterium]|nr:hypothetical protein [Patescibacteria group bacterium]